VRAVILVMVMVLIPAGGRGIGSSGSGELTRSQICCKCDINNNDYLHLKAPITENPKFSVNPIYAVMAAIVVDTYSDGGGGGGGQPSVGYHGTYSSRVVGGGRGDGVDSKPDKCCISQKHRTNQNFFLHPKAQFMRNTKLPVNPVLAAMAVITVDADGDSTSGTGHSAGSTSSSCCCNGPRGREGAGKEQLDELNISGFNT
jgi:hypothetical protein